YAEQKYGKLTLKQVMAPAIKLARDGFPLTWEEADWMHDQYLAKFPESHRVFQRNGDYYKPGELFQQPDLARTLERIAADPDDFYHGSLAREIAAAMQKGGGLITADDLAHYEVKEREPVRGKYRSGARQPQQRTETARNFQPTGNLCLGASSRSASRGKSHHALFRHR